MSLTARLGRLDRVQKSRVFMIAATVVLLLAAASAIGWGFLQAATDPSGVRAAVAALPQTVTDTEGNQIPNPALGDLATVQDVLNAARSPVSVAIGVLLLTGVMLLFVWLGLGLSYVGVSLLVAALATPLFLFEATRPFAWVVLGGGQLVLSFLVLMRAATLLLSPAVPALAIARNVLAEAVRMKISLIFIGMLIIVLAFMPLILNGEQPLRYRVQAFLQYANGLSFAIVALLVLFFGTATVAFEQRDKIIWQTMTKPVSALSYVFGKWLGVSLLAGVLLLVSSTGVFVFTEALRRTTAVGESAPYHPLDGTIAMTEDRLILESRVLTARKPVLPVLPFGINSPEIDTVVEARAAEDQRLNGYAPNASDLYRYRLEAFKEATTQYRSIDPNTERSEEFVFAGLGEAKRNATPMTLRYKINAEGNRPDLFYALTFVFEDGTVVRRDRTALGYSSSLQISPEFINQQGLLRVRVYNGMIGLDQQGRIRWQPNTNTVVIPPDGLEVSYRVGSFRGNFLRVQAVQWVKLAFLAMIAVCSATFLSFPVACLVSVGVFFLAESAGWVAGSLSGWGTTTTQGKFDLFRYIIFHFADIVSSLFVVYNKLRPTQRLADGIVLSWGSVAGGTAFLALAALIVFALGVYAFRSRQLAIYSGH